MPRGNPHDLGIPHFGTDFRERNSGEALATCIPGLSHLPIVQIMKSADPMLRLPDIFQIYLKYLQISSRHPSRHHPDIHPDIIQTSIQTRFSQLHRSGLGAVMLFLLTGLERGCEVSSVGALEKLSKPEFRRVSLRRSPRFAWPGMPSLGCSFLIFPCWMCSNAKNHIHHVLKQQSLVKD